MSIRIAALIGLALATSLSAQDSLHLREGQRVRVSTRMTRMPGTGTVIAFRNDTLVFRADRDGGAQTIVRGDLATLDTSKGSRNVGPGAFGGAIIGLGVGALAGALVSKLTTSRDQAQNRCPDGVCGLSELITIPAGGVVGFAVGGVIGSQLNAEGWAAVPLSIRAAVGPHGFTVAARWRLSWLGR
jgi:hypothetical protein